MTDFFRFPHTPHLAWLGPGVPRDDKVLAPAEAQALLAGEVVVEEKLDGANLGLSLAPDGRLRAQNRGQYLYEPHAGQFARLPAWLAQHEASLREVLMPELILFGEWCAYTHSIPYTALPDWFIGFDVYDRASQRFWSLARRNALLQRSGIPAVPEVAQGRLTLATVKRLLEETPSACGAPRVEGLVLRRDVGDWCAARAKLVRADFVQAIDTHWSRRAPAHNRLAAHPA
ncbi:MAG: RNA ligase family protein [Immundisolibacter sp.]|uniref:RNA ligase family protein n=1 Tax=Immundisolibacter sp. TaxID=1934948 RepID=UPI003D09C9C5